MHYHEMLPCQMREALKKQLPVLLGIGTLEFHSEHLPLGVDTQIVQGCLERLEKQYPNDVILLPPFYYGAASYAVAGPEDGRATIDIDSMAICTLAEQLFTGLLEAGFRNIHGFVYHQTENFNQGMPTDLAFRFAGRRAIFRYLEKNRGRGWWGDSSMKEYYSGDNIFDAIQIHRLAEEVRNHFGGDHAGKIETSAMMELYPHLVHMELHTNRDWFAQSALNATKEIGRDYVGGIVHHWEEFLGLDKKAGKASEQ